MKKCFCALAGGWLLLTSFTPQAAAEDKTVHLTVKVTDDSGKALSGARVNVYQDASTGLEKLGPSSRTRFRIGIVVPPDYQDETSADGLARLQILVKSGQKLGLS